MKQPSASGASAPAAGHRNLKKLRGDRTLHRLTDRVNARLEAYLPEQRLFLKSDTSTRFVRLRPLTQAVAIGVSTALVGWAILATSILLMDSIGSGNLRDQVMREQAQYEHRLNALAAERDRRSEEAEAAHARFAHAMARVAQMQSELLVSEERRLELETGIETIQRTLRRAVRERDEARVQLAGLMHEQGGNGTRSALEAAKDATDALDFLLSAIERTSVERDISVHHADQYRLQAEHMAMQLRLTAERNARIFTQLEEAVEKAMVPMERMFRSVGVAPQQILSAVRGGAQTDTPALRPIAISTQGTLDPESIEVRANAVIGGLDTLNRFRIGAGRMPLAHPVGASAVRQTSGFGMRRHPLTGRQAMHNGVDLSGPRGTAIRATADGVVQRAGRDGGYGNLVIIRHDFGMETYYAHLSSIDVRPGQRVSRGDRIGGMGSTGSSTGVHLHYEVRMNGRPVNPTTFIRAGQNVF